jgi:hypothetical protein
MAICTVGHAYNAMRFLSPQQTVTNATDCNKIAGPKSLSEADCIDVLMRISYKCLVVRGFLYYSKIVTFRRWCSYNANYFPTFLSQKRRTDYISMFC